MAADPLSRFIDEIRAISAEHDVDKHTAALVVGLQVMAMQDGVTNARDSLAWAMERGYVDETGSSTPGSYASDSHRVTDKGCAAVLAHFNVETGGANDG